MSNTPENKTNAVLTMADVIEKDRVLSGAESVTLSLGPNATPEGVSEELARLRAVITHYESFTDLERERACVARLKRVIRDIARTSRRPIDATREDLSAKLSSIFGMADMAGFGNVSDDIIWMEAQRQTKSARTA